MDPTLLSTKLLIPPLPREHVERARLEQALEEALQVPLVVISAPPGSGKTTLLSAWLKRITGHARTGWLTLDVDDNDPLRFWNYVASAFPLGQDSTAIYGLLTSAQAVPAFVRAWINALMSLPGPLVLVLDDYHIIQESTVHTSLLYLLEHCPNHLHVVIASRTDPPLPLARWRIRGQLLEIRSANLRFTPAETAAFLSRQIGADLLPEQVEELEKRTEGWAAALQAAAISLKGQPPEHIAERIARFSGRHHYLLDFLSDEVYDRQPQAVQQFLQITAILRQFTAPLCAELLAEAGLDGSAAQTTLMELDRANLFLVALDEERTWYRYHHLFGELLLARLKQNQSVESIARLYRRAALWHQANGWLAEAVSYAFLAQDQNLAAGLLENAVRQAEIWSSGEIRTVLGWMKSLPPEAMENRPWLRLYQSRALFVSGRMEQAENILDQLETLPDIDPQLPAHIAGSRARIAAARGEVNRAQAAARQALAELPPSTTLARSSAAASLGYTLLLQGQMQESLRWLQMAYEGGLANGFRLLAINALTNQAWAHMLMGKTAQAGQIIREGLRLGSSGDQLMPAAGLILTLQAWLLFERSDLPGADEALTEGLNLLAQGGIEDTTQTGAILQARILQAQHNHTRAAELLRQAVEMARASGLERTRRSVEAAQARCWLEQGNLRQAKSWAVRYQASPAVEYLHPTEDLVLARVLAAVGEPQAALGVAQSVRAAAEKDGRMRIALEAQLVLARVFQALNRPDSAQAALLQALQLGEEQNVPQVFRVEGVELRPLLLEAARRGVALPLLDALLDDASGPVNLRAPLSERELEVLHLLAEGLGNREIAQRLSVAETTVKKHINHIFDKLDVTSRTQALLRARDLRLI
ncbi:MAG: AAA family ATPase [Anaerolineae bacterium]|nr:AAA family ATPase [Anaerolineae bacterium]